MGCDSGFDMDGSGIKAGREVRRGEGPVSLGEGLRRVIAELGIETKILEQRAVKLWPEVVLEMVGEDGAQVARLEGIRRGELFVVVKQDAWRHRLLFERERIRERLNCSVGREVVRSIRFGKA